MEKECLVEETSIDYRERNVFDDRDPNQTPKSSGLKIKTKKVLGKPLGKINFDDGDFLDESALLPPPLLFKFLVQVSVYKSFALNIDLVAIVEKSSQEKLNFIKNFFSGVNGFGGASTPSKFGGIICATFTFEKAMMAAANLANKHGVVVNTNFKHPGYNCTNQAIVLKEIPVRTSIETVHAAVSEFGIIKSIKMQLADFLASMWSILIGKDADSKDRFRALLYTLLVGMNAHNLWDFFVSVGGKTCVINCNSVNYTCACCATVCFDFEEDMNQAVAVMPIIKSVGFYWSCLSSPVCSACSSFGHTSLFCKSVRVSSISKSKRAPLSAHDRFRLAKIYEKKSAPISHPLAFVAGSFLSGSFLGYDSQLGFLRNSKPLPPVVNNLKLCLVNIESSFVSLVGQISELAKRLKSFVPAVFQSSPGCQLLVTSLSQNQGEDIVMEMGSGEATSGKTAAVLGSNASPKVPFGMLGWFSFSEWYSFSTSFSMSSLVWKIAICNVHGLNNPAKQDDVIYWHKDMNNLVSIFMKSKLKGRVCSWLADKFDGVRVFTSNLDSGSLGAGVMIVVNFSLAKHVCKVSEVPSQLLSIRLLFKNKLSVSILGLYAGASLVVWFSQASEINFLIVKAINEFFFVILGGDFNEDGSRKCASFKKCLELGLVNSLIGSLAIRMPIWMNFRGVMKTIDYVFVSLNLVNSLVHHGVSDVGDYFDTDHQAVSVSLSLGGLLDTHLFFLCKQVNKDHWKFDVKNANVMAANTVMFSGVFSDANIIRKIMVLLAGSTFKKKWFKSFDMVHNRVSSRFHKLELLVSKLVKASHLSSSVSFALLLVTWDNLNSAGALSVKFMFHSGAKFDDICSALAKARRLYYSSKLLKSNCAEESHIRQAINNRIESFELDKSHTIRSVLECLFHKVVLNYLVINDEKHMIVDDISDTWSRQYRPLNYIFDDAFSGVMSKIDVDELHCVVSSLPDGKAASLLVLGLFLVLLNFCLSCELESVFMNTCPIALIETTHKILFKILSDRISLACSSYDVLHVKYQENVYDYRLNSHFVSRSGRIESQAGLSSFFTVGAFVDDTIWVGGSQTATQHILNIASEFFRVNDISINNDKTVVIPINCRYLSIFLLTKGFSKPSLAKAHSDICFFTNLILKKAVSDKQFLYLVSAVLHPIIDYRMQFSYIPNALICRGLKLKAGLLLNFPSNTIYHPFFYGLKLFSQCQSESKVALLISFILCWWPIYPLIFPACIRVSVSNNFLAGMIHILFDCDLFLGGSLTSAFWFCDEVPMSVVLGESLFFKFLLSLWHFGIAFVNQLHNQHGVVFSWCIFKQWKRLDFHGPVPDWFRPFVAFLAASHFSSAASVGVGSLNFCESDDFVSTHNCLFQINLIAELEQLFFFEDIDLGVGVGVQGLAIVLALECMPVAHFVNLFSDSQAALDAYKSELSLVCLDFRNQCWVKCQHIQNVIYSKNLRVSWHKVKGHSSVSGNDCADSITDAAFLSDWYLSPCMNGHFLLADGGIVSGNSKHFV
ncbi:hypothetical protein G9A89_015354 [Geosiphon pyriformis]|nr:hypothetical protein G9A89_015354 [Geosiphon pyriformis]